MASIVIKVKYEETLRRFNVAITVEQRLDLSMKGLRLKIISLFNLPSFTEFCLTYEDEDDDLVTLVDDDDLHDIVRQGLDPVRIAVHLNSVQSAQSLSAPSTGSAAPITPSPLNVQPNIDPNVAEVLKSPNSQQSSNPDAAKIMKSVQKPLAQALSNLSLDSSSKATFTSKMISTSPVFPGLVGGLTKMGNVNGLNAAIPNHGATCVSGHANVGNHSTTNPDGRKYEGARTDDIERVAGVSVPLKGRNISVEYSSNKMREYLSMINGDVSLKKCSSNNESDDENKTWAELMNTVSVKEKNVSCESSPNKMCGSAGMKKGTDVFSRKKHASSKEGDKAKTWAELVNSQKDASKKESVRQAVARYGGFNPFLTQTPLGECPFTGIPLGFQRTSDPLLLEQIRSSNRSLNKADSLNSVVHKGITCDGCEVHPIVGPRFKSKVRYDYDLCSDCFYEIGNESDYDRIVLPLEYKHLHPFNAPDVANGLGPVLHKGVGCDGCRILPIVGPRFKSKVRYDYDLCNNCFTKMGNDTDYIKIDSPLTYKHPVSFKASDKSPRSYTRSRKLKQPHSRLDSRFIFDVNVMDGTTMAPSTPFTKIWRMRNNGTLPWKRDMQLLWIGGDRVRPSDSIGIQIPSSGVDVDCELDIAVDFVAPELPGKYVSFWRMAEQSGHKFGQRVWVQIQVDPSVDLTRETSPMLNLNLRPGSNETAFSKVVYVKVEPESDIEVGESSSPSVHNQNFKIQMESLNFPINNDLLVGASDVLNLNAEKPRSVVAPSPNFYPDGVDDIGVSVDAPSNVQDDSNILDRNDVLDNNNTFGKNDVQDDEYTLGKDNVHDDNNTLNKDNVQDGDNTLDVNINVEQIYVRADVEEELEQMGFKQFDMNKEALETNEYDSDRSLNGLSDDSEWDPILEELKEMGFEDKDTNKKLLEKNNGSISHVVMDLIAEEKAQYGHELST